MEFDVSRNRPSHNGQELSNVPMAKTELVGNRLRRIVRGSIRRVGIVDVSMVDCSRN